MEKSSMTALVCAHARARHDGWYKDVPVLRDPIARQLLTEEEMAGIDQYLLAGLPFLEPGFSGSAEEGLHRVVDRHLSPNPLGRAAFAETRLEAAVRLGVRQYLLLAAGFDAFAWRKPAWAAPLRIIEIDHPATAAEKTARVMRAMPEPVPNLWRVAADLTQPGWTDHLAACPGFDAGQPSFASLLGFVYYADRAALRDLLCRLAALQPPGGSLVFDYPMAPEETEGIEDGRPVRNAYRPDARWQRQEAMAAAAGEPMVPGYGYRELEKLLADCGYLLYEHLDPDEIMARHFQAHNEAYPQHPIEPFGCVGFCLAVRHG